MAQYLDGAYAQWLQVYLGLKETPVSQKKFLKLNPLQTVERDFSFILDKDISAGDIIRFLSSLDRKLIKDIRIFDL